MQVKLCLFILLVCSPVFGVEYFQYEFNYKEEHKKLTIIPSGKYEYITYGVASGCFDFNGKRVGTFKKFNFKKLYDFIKKNSLTSKNISRVMFVKKGVVEVFGLGSKAMDKVHELLFEASIYGEKSEGISFTAKRINNKKIQVNFLNVGDKKKEIYLTKDLNQTFKLKGVKFNSQRLDEVFVLDNKNKRSSIVLEAKSSIPKNEVLRYFDSVALLGKKKMSVLNNTHLCSSI